MRDALEKCRVPPREMDADEAAYWDEGYAAAMAVALAALCEDAGEENGWLILQVANALHEGVPGWEPVMSLSDLSDDQTKRLRAAIRCVALFLSPTAPDRTER